MGHRRCRQRMGERSAFRVPHIAPTEAAMPEHPRQSDHQVDEQDHASATRRAMLWLGGRLGLAASLGALPAAAKQKKKKNKEATVGRVQAQGRKHDGH